MRTRVVLLVFLLTAFASAQTASREKVLELLDVIQAREAPQQMVQAWKTAILKSVIEEAKADPERTLSDAQMQQLRAFVDLNITPKMMDKMVEVLIPIYQAHFTDAEIDDMLTFYRSPTGQKAIAERGALFRDSTSQMSELMKSWKEDWAAQVRAHAQALTTAVTVQPERIEMVGGSVSAPRVVDQVNPRCQSAGTGVVVLRAVVSAEGTAKEVQVVGSLDPATDKEAVRVIKLWRFEPARKNGSPVSVRADFNLTFKCGG